MYQMYQMYYVPNLSQIVGVRSNVNTNANMSYLDERENQS